MEQPPNKYVNGKIYKLTDIGYNECYYGSTRNILCKRFGSHVSQYRRYKNGKGKYVSSFSLFDKYGLENCKIELVELYPCGSRNELEMREGYYISNNKCLNKNLAGVICEKQCKELYQKRVKKIIEEHEPLTMEERINQNREYNKKLQLKWRELNKERVVAYRLKYKLKKQQEKEKKAEKTNI
jgi:hypothetical protein